MVSISKRTSGAWQNTSYGIRATATDTITTLPTTIYGDGTNTTVSIKGNTVQSGTPTPTAPIPVLGVGELDSEQYKIPISSAGTTTPVYLGEVETTRRIKKLVLTGEESGTVAINNTYHIFAIRGIFNSEPGLLQVGGVCTHYKYNNAASNLVNNMQNGDFVLNKIVDDYSFTIKDNNFNTDDDFKSYLAAQYAAGTPVTVWYVLATKETAVVNEPLMCIGDYADEVSGVSIPTTDGANTLSVDTTVQPSEVSVNYHGWHMGTVHERTAGQWD